MKLYLVSVDDHGFDEFDSFVVRAESKYDAREIESNYLGCYDSKEKWLYDSFVEEITVDGESEVILGSFNAG